MFPSSLKLGTLHSMFDLLWAPADYTNDLIEEIRRKDLPIINRQGSLFLIPPTESDFVWIDARGRRAEVLPFSSISSAQALLRERGKLWTQASTTHFRRSELIAQDLLQPKIKKRKFLEKMPTGHMGAFALVSENEMWVTHQLEPAVPPASWEFEESKEAPSRAYLKLWELFTREGFAPKKGERCLELGSAPGGWSWVLKSLGCQVIAVDKGEMDPKVMAGGQVEWLRQDAFTLDPKALGKIDWFFSDMICYPPKLLDLVTEWIENDWAKNFVCTLKFQGPTDFKTLETFLKIPNSKAVHLHYNRHEVTWIKRGLT